SIIVFYTMETDKDLFIAKLAEQAERFEDMVTHMKIVIRNQSGTISSEIRNLLSVAYKNVIGARRSAWRILSTIENNEKQKNKEETSQQAQKYRERVEVELDDICNDIIEIIDEIIGKNCTGDSPEAQNGRVFFS
ncbi:14-3-3 family protein, partial [Salmonella sp. s51228]|uniref:14-3-3 family protein n=1 Tax=Salmonella sp. s51228 TaxID=3159652 RepID=UPI00397E9483